MARYRLYYSLGRRVVIRHLHRWAKRHFSDLKTCSHQKLSDARLVTPLLSRLVFKHPFPSIRWNILREDRIDLPSYTQAYTRGQQLLERLEVVAMPPRPLAEVTVNSMSRPVCRPKHS